MHNAQCIMHNYATAQQIFFLTTNYTNYTNFGGLIVHCTLNKIRLISVIRCRKLLCIELIRCVELIRKILLVASLCKSASR